MPCNSDTPEAGNVPQRELSAAEIARDWQKRQGTTGPSRAYVSACIKKGCPKTSFDAAWQWRVGNAKYGIGYRSGGAKKAVPQPMPSDSETEPPATPPGERPPPPKNMIPRPENGHLLSLWDSLDAAIKIEGLAFSNAYAKPSEQCIRAYNNARDGRYAAEKAYLDALERHKVLVPMNEAKIFGSKGYRLMLPELQALGEKIAEDSSDDPDVRARIKTTTIAKVVAIIRKAQGAFADAA